MSLREDWEEFEPQLRRAVAEMPDEGDQRRFADLSILSFILGQICKNSDESGREGERAPQPKPQET